MIAPFVEESLKGIALVLLFLLIPAETNTMRDGIVYGALVGLAFAVVESTAFIISGYIEDGSAEYLAQLIPRFVLFGLNGHTLYTALFGAALGWARQSTTYGAVRKSLTIAGGFVLALAAHGMANAFGPFALSVFASLTGLGPTVTASQLWFLDLATVIATNVWAYVIILYMVIRSGYWELEVCRSELTEEVPERSDSRRARPHRRRGALEDPPDSGILISPVGPARQGAERTGLPTSRCEEGRARSPTQTRSSASGGGSSQIFARTVSRAPAPHG